CCLFANSVQKQHSEGPQYLRPVNPGAGGQLLCRTIIITMFFLMKRSLLALSLLAYALGAHAQGGVRLFLDIPELYFHAPNVEHFSDRLGAGAGTAMNFATHWGTARIGGGATFTLAPKAEDVGGSFLTMPYGLLEVGLGKYRSNGNRCAKTKQNAYTAMAKAGMRYSFNPDAVLKSDRGTLDFAVGAELGYFFIRDVFKNYEIFTAGHYLTQSKVVQVNFGFKLFLNLRADR
ncbi:MAG TPA: hypothetical protein PK858_00330, partial [Saprospiraceae bacterium]|nr:hypothetical protein [Saprospiraceae bacterium]